MSVDLSQICGRCRFYYSQEDSCNLDHPNSERKKFKNTSSCANWSDKDAFHFYDDPSFEGHDRAWWDRWNKNTRIDWENAPKRICDGCVHEQSGGACSIHSSFFQGDALLAHSCADRVSKK